MATEKKTGWKKVRAYLRHKYRLVILNDSTFGESFSLRLSPLSLIIGVLAITIVMTTLVISLVAFTPLREYIPGYGTVAERKQILELSLRTDSIEQALLDREAYMNNLLNVLKDSLETKAEKPIKDTSGKFKKLDIEPGPADKMFRKEYDESRENSTIVFTNPKLKGLADLVFYTPVKGIVTSSYSMKDQHYGIDIVTKEDELVKCILDGTVVFTGFSAEDGYVIHVQHSNNLTSIYKHNAELLKRTGERIKSGEVVSVVGNSGERSKGPHLHLEIWYNGIAINPQDCIAF